MAIYLSMACAYSAAIDALKAPMSKTLHYVFDPLCGWCYGAGPALEAVAGQAGLDLQLRPSGLFADAGARPMDDAFAAYAWSNDQRIERLSGQPFSERYRSQVLADRQQRFDSGPATLALSAVALTSAPAELAALKAIQKARYVDGADVTRSDVLVALLHSLGLEAAAQRLAQRDPDLLAEHQARLAQAQALQQAFGARGVPFFILETPDGRRQSLPAGLAYAGPQAFAAQLLAA